MGLVAKVQKLGARVVPCKVLYLKGVVTKEDLADEAGYAFIEFATIEGSSKAKKALNGRRFGPNLVDAEYFSEDKYHARDFARPTPNVDEPRREVGMELALVGDGAGLEEAPVMVE